MCGGLENKSGVERTAKIKLVFILRAWYNKHKVLSYFFIREVILW